MLRSLEQSRAVFFFRSHESVRKQATRPCRQVTFLKITVDTRITLFFNMLQLSRAAVIIDLASGVDCNICNLFFSRTNFDHLMLKFPNIFA